jgi:dienelactone hydrolase
MREEAVVFGKSSSLVGIITDPPASGGGHDFPAVLLLNAGRTHRVGPNRLHVRIARTLAAMGFVVLRFDFSSIGDSQARQDHLPAERSTLVEAQEAMDYLASSRAIDRFVLIGLCSGGSTAFNAACCDQRVVGAVVINARYHLSDAERDFDSKISDPALARHYFRIALSSSFRAKNWLKLLTGKVDYSTPLKALVSFSLSRLGVGRSWESFSTNGLMADLRTLGERGVHLLHVYSEGDQSLDCYQLVVDRMKSNGEAHELLKAEVIPGANHAFTMRWSQGELLRVIGNWAQVIVADKATSIPVAS